jgi:hypothetical protein
MIDWPPATPPANPYGYLPPPPPPRASNRRWWLLGIALAAVMVLMAGASVIVTVHLVRGRTPAATPHRPKLPPVTTVAAGDGQALKGYLLPPPSGASTLRTFNSSFGIQTVTQYATRYEDSTFGAAWLTGEGFAVAASVGWADPHLSSVSVSLIQFHDADGATSFALNEAHFRIKGPDLDEEYPLTGLPNGHDFESKPAADGTHSSVLIASDGNVVLQMWLSAPGPIDRSAATTLFQRQYAVLDPQPWAPSTVSPKLAPQQTMPLAGKPLAAIPGGDAAALLRHLAPADSVETFPVGGSPEGVLSMSDLTTNTHLTIADLQTMGERATVANEWITANGVEVYTRLTQFRTAGGAATYFTRTKANRFGYNELGMSYPLTGAGPAYGFEMSAFNASGSRSFDMLYQDATVVIEMSAYTPDHIDVPASIVFLQNQIDALARP